MKATLSRLQPAGGVKKFMVAQGALKSDTKTTIAARDASHASVRGDRGSRQSCLIRLPQEDMDNSTQLGLPTKQLVVAAGIADLTLDSGSSTREGPA